MTSNLFESVAVFAFSFPPSRQHNPQILKSLLLGQVFYTSNHACCNPLDPLQLLHILLEMRTQSGHATAAYQHWAEQSISAHHDSQKDTMSGKVGIRITRTQQSLSCHSYSAMRSCTAAIMSHDMSHYMWAQTIWTGTHGPVPRPDSVTWNLSWKLPLSPCAWQRCSPPATLAPWGASPGAGGRLQLPVSPSMQGTAGQVAHSKWLEQHPESNGAESQGRICSMESCEMSPLLNSASSIHHCIIF